MLFRRWDCQSVSVPENQGDMKQCAEYSCKSCIRVPAPLRTLQKNCVSGPPVPSLVRFVL